jgi:hypothetical protein
MKMRYLIIAACCAAIAGSIPVASARTTGQATHSIKAHSPLDANAKMKKKHAKKSATKSGDSMSKDSMSKDGMKKETK